MMNQNQETKQKKLKALENLIENNKPFFLKLNEWCANNKAADNPALVEPVHIYMYKFSHIEEERSRLAFMSPEEVSICFHHIVSIEHQHMLKAKTQINDILNLENDMRDEFKKTTFH